MTLLALQIGLTLLLAFVTGCVAGCWLSGVIGRRRAAAYAELDQLPDQPCIKAESFPVRGSQAPDPAVANATADADIADDLKLLSGVGPKLERKLNSLGVTRFSQVAAWDRADIERFDAELSFKGRIEREGWVSQARMLARGGAIDGPAKRAGKSVQPRRPAGK